MYKAIVFAGTTEGYALCEFLAEIMFRSMPVQLRNMADPF